VNVYHAAPPHPTRNAERKKYGWLKFEPEPRRATTSARDAGKARVGQKVHMVVLGIRPAPFLPSRTPRKVDALVLALGDRLLRTGNSVGRSSVLSGRCWQTGTAPGRTAAAGTTCRRCADRDRRSERELALDNAGVDRLVFPGSSIGPMWAIGPGAAVKVSVALFPSGPSSSLSLPSRTDSRDP